MSATADNPTSPALSDERFQQIRDRAGAAIPGPWRWYGNTETGQVYLGTPDRGRLYILGLGIERTELIGDHEEGESWPEEQAVEIAGERVINRLEQQGLALHVGEEVVFFDPETWSGDERVAQSGYEPVEGEPPVSEQILDRQPFTVVRAREGRIALDSDERYARYTQHQPILRFPSPAEDREHRNRHGALMEAHAKHVAYEVLDGQTRAEAGLEESSDSSNSPLYREDFVAIRTPEAELIAHAREDIDLLLQEVERLRAANQNIG